ncbi:MAG: 50S ribosomal protein L9 [Eubacteriales bacterium]|nr:50S ribosomal protein L9 [Eubacteriales bacterium]
MKVILLKDIKGTGKKDAVIEVSDGYARNFLFPRKLAVEASSVNLNSVKVKNQTEAHRREMERQNAVETAAGLKDKSVVLEVATGENGKLFGSVTNKEVAEAVASQLGLTVDKKKVAMETVRATGEYTADIRLFEGVSAAVRVIVKAK